MTLFNIQENVPMRKYLSLRCGGNARYFAEINNVNELQEAQKFALSKGIPIFLLGQGTNILLSDSGYSGLILKLIKFMVIFIIVAPILLITLRIIFKNIHENNSGRLMNVSINCTLHDKTYGYEFNYYETTGEIKEAGGDGYLANITGLEKYGDAYQVLDVIDENGEMTFDRLNNTIKAEGNVRTIIHNIDTREIVYYDEFN